MKTLLPCSPSVAVLTLSVKDSLKEGMEGDMLSNANDLKCTGLPRYAHAKFMGFVLFREYCPRVCG